MNEVVRVDVFHHSSDPEDAVFVECLNDAGLHDRDDVMVSIFDLDTRNGRRKAVRRHAIDYLGVYISKARDRISIHMHGPSGVSLVMEAIRQMGMQ